MAKNPKNVWDFENKLKSKVRIKAERDYEELLDENPDLAEPLKLRIKMQMEMAKKQDLMLKYIDQLKT